MFLSPILLRFANLMLSLSLETTLYHIVNLKTPFHVTIDALVRVTLARNT